MPKTRKTYFGAGCFVVAFFLCSLPAVAFHGGHTGVTETQLKNACPAFSSGAINLFDSVAPPGNLPMTDIFEHESGARCACTRNRTDRHAVRCGPTAAAPRSPG
jgi:hypothetical protein